MPLPAALKGIQLYVPLLNASDDVFHLQRFVEAQASTFASARAELAAGRKQTHWMWFIFPQLQGLGSSAMAQQFALSGLREAAAYLEHPLLGARLRECTALVNRANAGSASDIFGYPDDLKFHSSMTLFHRVCAEGNAPTEPFEDVFAVALARYFDRTEDQRTLSRLRAENSLTSR